MLDYNEIVEQLNSDKVKQLLEKLSIPYEETESYLVMPTICHNEDVNSASWKLYFYKDNHFFYCYTECHGLSIFKFLESYYKTHDYNYEWYYDVYLVAKDCANLKDSFESLNRYKSEKDLYKSRVIPKLEAYDEGVMDSFIKVYPIEWLNDGISKEAMDKFNVRYSISQNKIIIPHYDVEGRLVGIRGRALNEWEVEMVGKYMPVKVEQTFYTHKLSLNLYGLYQNAENIRRRRVCYLFESEKSILQLDSFDMDNCGVAVCGSNFNIYQLKILLKECHPKEIIICFDKEELPGQDRYFNKLWKIKEKYKNYCKISFIYDRENLLELKDSPTDKGEEIFRKLLERRVKI